MNLRIHNENNRILDVFARYLNDFECAIKKENVDEVVSCGVSRESAVKYLMAEFCGIDTLDSEPDREFFRNTFSKCIKKLNVSDYSDNLYLKKILTQPEKIGKWHINFDTIKPYQAFVWNDIAEDEDGKIYPQIGYFEEEFKFPAVYENKRLWMSVVPNEIETMKEVINASSGCVCSVGLGLGYFQYMAHLSEKVESVTVIEKDAEVIALFKKCILPYFDFPEKIIIKNEDAFQFFESDEPKNYDLIFTDIWHDVGDGLPIYKKIKPYESKFPATKFYYWIEKSMKCYL